MSTGIGPGTLRQSRARLCAHMKFVMLQLWNPDPHIEMVHPLQCVGWSQDGVLRMPFELGVKGVRYKFTPMEMLSRLAFKQKQLAQSRIPVATRPY